MMNKTYLVREIVLGKTEVEKAIKEYIERHNDPSITFPENLRDIS